MSAQILVIGAGPVGLAIARALREKGLAYDHVERNAGPGGVWDIDAPGTPMYESVSGRRGAVSGARRRLER